jgi:putative Mn2+ efflux pump MntP
MAFAEVSLWLPALIIGCTTFLVSLVGIALGYSLGRFIKGSHYAVALGGCVLIGIGFKILLEHGAF